MKATKPVTHRSGDLDAMFALLPAAQSDEQAVVRVVVRTFFGTLHIYAAQPDPSWEEGTVAIRVTARCVTLNGDDVGEWQFVRTGPDPERVVYWTVCSKRSDRIMEMVESSRLERWKRVAINGHDISHFSDEHDERTVYPPNVSAARAPLRLV